MRILSCFFSHMSRCGTKREGVEEQHKEVYSQFGAVAARVSSFEIVLTNILLANAKGSGRVATDEEFDKMKTNLQNRKTLGELIKTVNTEVAIPELTEKVVNEALKRRNYLMHHFFREKAFEFETEEGRKRLLKELLEAHALIVAATKLANDLCLAMAKDFGITIEEIEAEADDLRRKARSRSF